MTKEEQNELLAKVAKRPGINEFDVLGAQECGCLFCGEVYSARRISDWAKIPNSLMAICPVCGAGALVSDTEGLDLHSKEFSSLHQRFLRKYPDYRTSAYRRFCALYQDGVITRDAGHSALYEIYLTYLYHAEKDSFACLSLARYYSKGDSLHPQDIDQAITLYRDRDLKTNMMALYELGNCYTLRGKAGDKRLAFESYSKAAALGSTRASLAIAYTYLFGDYVRRDEGFGFECLLRIFDEIYPNAIRDPFPLEDFARAAYILGVCFYSGYGTNEDRDRSVRYFLIAILCAQTHAEQFPNEDKFSFEKNLTDYLDELCPPDAPERAPSIVFDADTFIDSFWDQSDNVSKKEISNIHYEDKTLEFDLDSEVPLIIVDQGNGKVSAVGHMSWTFRDVTFEKKSDDLKFEEISFLCNDKIQFVHHDPMGGETVVMEIVFQPVEGQ